MAECHIWDSTDTNWNVTDFNWNEICVAADVVVGTTGGGGYTAQLTRLRKQKKKDQKTFIKLLCKIKGEEYEQTKYFRPNIHVKVGDFKLIERFLEKPEISIFINKGK